MAQCSTRPMPAQLARGRAAAAPLLPLPPARRRAARHAARCSQQPSGRNNHTDAEQQQQGMNSLAALTLKAVLVGTAANAIVACLPVAAHAAGGAPGNWHPRRHIHSRLRERHSTEETPKQAATRRATQKQQAAAAAAQQAAGPAAAGFDLQQMVQSAQRSLQRLWRGEEAYSVGISADRQQVYGSGRGPAPSPYGWVPLAAAGGVLLLLVFGRNLRLPWGGSRSGRGGRWVRDRSLGGKMIFIPDAEPGPTKAPRPLWEDLEDEGSSSGGGTAGSSRGSGSDSEAGPWSTANSAAASAALQQQQRGREPELPSWWKTPNFLVYAPFSRKDELQRQARVALRQLEDAKLLQGLDYPLSALVSLRTLCQEAGGYQVKPRTESGRDAMLRAGVRAGIAAAQEGQYALLGGDHPAKFVCGLAHDLGVPDARAITIVHAEVAAVCRAALIDAEAAYRASNSSDILLALVRIAGALQAFPLPAGSAEAELVAAGVVKQTSLEFRKAVFLEFGSVSSELAALVAEMLGFNPELVMPFLQQTQAAAQAAQDAAAGAAQQAQQAVADAAAALAPAEGGQQQWEQGAA